MDVSLATSSLQVGPSVFLDYLADHPLVATVPLMLAFYLAIGALTLSAGASTVIVALQCVLFVLVQYVLGRGLALRSVGARPLRASETPRLHKAARETAEEMGIEKPRLLVGLMGTPNAFAVGRRASSDVVFSQSLLEELDPDEQKAVLAHEMAHIRNRDAIVLLLGQTVATACGLAVAWVTFFAGRDGPLRAIAGAAGVGVQIVVSLLSVGIVRRREFHADAVAAEHTDPAVLARALETDRRARERAGRPRGAVGSDGRLQPPRAVYLQRPQQPARAVVRHPPLRREPGRAPAGAGGRGVRRGLPSPSVAPASSAATGSRFSHPPQRPP